MSSEEGISTDKLADLTDFEASTAFSDVEKRVLRFTAALTRTPAHVTEELFVGLFEHFNAKQMVELTSVIAWENFRARFNRGFGIEAEGFTDCAACLIPGASRSTPSAV